MFIPSLREVQDLAARYSFIPVKLTLLADKETPIRLYQKFRSVHSFLLESVEGGARWARYSFIGLRPFLILEAKGTQIRLTHRNGTVEQRAGNPLQVLKEVTARYRSPKLPQMPRLCGGAVGYFGYNTLQYCEKIPSHAREPLDMADLRFLLVDEVIAFDHWKQEIQLVVNMEIQAEDDEGTIAEKYAKACDRLLQIADQALAEPPESEHPRQIPIAREPHRELYVKANMEPDEYERMVERAKAYIAAGDIFQVVLSQRFEVETAVDPFSVYRVLRTLNPSPYMYYLQFEKETIVGASPELQVRVEDGRVEMRPIAGTRRRGGDAAEDEALARDLLADPKERAEHTMLLDLGRNDIGRVAAYGSVKVEEQMIIERYSHVMHMVSHVSGTLRDGLHPLDALLSTFPAGTVSGAPKLRAMEIIAELERDARHTYAGAIGYLSFTGDLDTCITIRTLLFADGKAHIQAGAGIVADSVPRHEHQECINKAAAMIKALAKAEQLFPREEEKPCCLKP
ncbi:anthranilate synthase component I [Brevibacillus sp. SYP-B805]|uniref:anthranilate synthase component I n=1 Tax=Brevibacillus sp. SYP-B805 TaxID=1578199 RepID=UPI0013EAE6F3|nr:anthranilate synthase component I [Brevibacillus sp. SYP-B805]NGQ94565.1 anthranilate synthase component I [Brevibacillus sp. SYP-B805]